MVQEFELRIVQDFLFRLLVENADVSGRAVQPDHRPAEPSREGDDIFRAAQALRWPSIPEREQQPALVDGFNAAFVVARFARLIAACHLNRGGPPQDLLRARPTDRVEILPKLLHRQW